MLLALFALPVLTQRCMGPVGHALSAPLAHILSRVPLAAILVQPARTLEAEELGPALNAPQALTHLKEPLPVLHYVHLDRNGTPDF